ncbi:DUF488 domain-containing protein [uncultured Brevibacillus sp.]|uniref:DUF488 domain-containing protein n=1 Tax=uncultured Brevibacillus sp. TaxID=169970 RepID=UPI002596CAD3|nr:DUF488 domain-containing protein [uncultured Brevibacillus sp.]
MLVTTIGFSKKSLRTFASTLQHHKVERVIDTRLQNTSQLAGFAKKDDLEYVLELLNIEYIHDLSLAPTEPLLKAIKQKELSWGEFELCRGLPYLPRCSSTQERFEEHTRVSEIACYSH